MTAAAGAVRPIGGGVPVLVLERAERCLGQCHAQPIGCAGTGKIARMGARLALEERIERARLPRL